MYSDYNTCKAVVERGYSFIFPCKEESHRWLTETVKRSYLREYNKNAWVTDKEIREGNVRQLAECGKARRKIENEHNNVLKNCGYNLEHNFGHGKRHACEIYAILNLPGKCKIAGTSIGYLDIFCNNVASPVYIPFWFSFTAST
ncbi:MAG: hypothetical protein LBP80_11835 [Treponema sp.]|nr:hypothetical protein [Treponema sp.]